MAFLYTSRSSRFSVHTCSPFTYTATLLSRNWIFTVDITIGSRGSSGVHPALPSDLSPSRTVNFNEFGRNLYRDGESVLAVYSCISCRARDSALYTQGDGGWNDASVNAKNTGKHFYGAHKTLTYHTAGIRSPTPQQFCDKHQDNGNWGVAMLTGVVFKTLGSRGNRPRIRYECSFKDVKTELMPFWITPFLSPWSEWCWTMISPASSVAWFRIPPRSFPANLPWHATNSSLTERVTECG